MNANGEPSQRLAPEVALHPKILGMAPCPDMPSNLIGVLSDISQPITLPIAYLLESRFERKLNLARSSGTDRANWRSCVDRSDDAAEASRVRRVENGLRRT